ncbi:MAG: hypothetical protein MRY64_15430 [Hyphomonadaceae bacterium]|nr:hypothetical protein [Hyphomonadaceae bacterium]
MKERFTSEQWELLKYLPFQVFTAVAGADGNIDRKEIATFFDEIQKAALLKNELHREVMIELAQVNPEKYIRESMDFQKTIDSAELIKVFLKETLTESEFQDFVASVFITGIKVANASGGGWFGGSKISKEERQALAVIAAVFELDLKRLKS